MNDGGLAGLDQTGWNEAAAQYYMACINSGGSSMDCETATNNYMSGGAGTGFFNNTSSWIDLIGELGSTAGNVYNQFTNPQFQPAPINQPRPQPQQQNTLLYIGVAVAVLIIIVLLIRKR